MDVSEKSHCSGVDKFIRMSTVYFVLKYAIPGKVSCSGIVSLNQSLGQQKKSEKTISEATISHSFLTITDSVTHRAVRRP